MLDINLVKIYLIYIVMSLHNNLITNKAYAEADRYW